MHICGELVNFGRFVCWFGSNTGAHVCRFIVEHCPMSNTEYSIPIYNGGNRGSSSHTKKEIGGLNI